MRGLRALQGAVGRPCVPVARASDEEQGRAGGAPTRALATGLGSRNGDAMLTGTVLTGIDRHVCNAGVGNPRGRFGPWKHVDADWDVAKAVIRSGLRLTALWRAGGRSVRRALIWVIAGVG